jgi:hypothetical protein
MKKETIVYTAGLFDGEGCIVITRGPKKNGRGKIYNCVAIRMEICNTDHDLIKWIKKIWDEGHICKIPPRKVKHGMSKPQLRWQLTHRQAHRVLKHIMPYMREQNKLAKANEVIEYYRTLN